MKGLLTLYLVSFTRIKKSSWGKNSLFMILGIIIAVGALTLAMILFESYEKTLNNAFKVSQPDISIVNNGEELTEDRLILLKNILANYKSDIKAVDQKYQMSVILSTKEYNKPAFIESYSNESKDYNNFLYSFSQQDNFFLEDDEIILGEYLARELNANIGDKIEVILPSSIRYSIFGLVKKSDRFTVKDINKTGLYEIDARRAILNKDKIKKIMGNFHSSSSYAILLNDRDNDVSNLISSKINYQLMLKLPTLYAIDLFSHNSMIFSALSLQKIMIFLILCIIIIVAGFNVISTVSTIINEKISEIGILMTLGLKRREIKLIYFIFALLLSHLVIIIELLCGYGSAYWLTHQDYISLKGDIYFIDKILINPSLSMFLIIYATAVLIISLTILFTLRNINKLEIIKIMRQ